MTRNHAVITGRDRPDVVATPIDALREHYHAINHRDLAVLRASWLDSDEVSMRDPVGGIQRGWAAVAAEYERIFGGTAQVHVELHEFTIHEHGDVFWAVGSERGWFKAGDTRLDLAIRRTRVFRRVGGRWRQVHDHGSIEIPELLARYQAAVR